MFLMTSPPAQAFLSLVNLLSRPCLRAFFTNDEEEIAAYYRVLENLQADTFPKIYANCKNLGLRVPEEWFRSLLVEQVGFETVCRLWDQVRTRMPLLAFPISANVEMLFREGMGPRMNRGNGTVYQS